MDGVEGAKNADFFPQKWRGGRFGGGGGGCVVSRWVHWGFSGWSILWFWYTPSGASSSSPFFWVQGRGVKVVLGEKKKQGFAEKNTKSPLDAVPPVTFLPRSWAPGTRSSPCSLSPTSLLDDLHRNQVLGHGWEFSRVLAFLEIYNYTAGVGGGGWVNLCFLLRSAKGSPESYPGSFPGETEAREGPTRGRAAPWHPSPWLIGSSPIFPTSKP